MSPHVLDSKKQSCQTALTHTTILLYFWQVCQGQTLPFFKKIPYFHGTTLLHLDNLILSEKFSFSIIQPRVFGVYGTIPTFRPYTTWEVFQPTMISKASCDNRIVVPIAFCNPCFQLFHPYTKNGTGRFFIRYPKSLGGSYCLHFMTFV